MFVIMLLNHVIETLIKTVRQGWAPHTRTLFTLLEPASEERTSLIEV